MCDIEALNPCDLLLYPLNSLPLNIYPVLYVRENPCCGLNANVLHRLMYLKTWYSVSGTIYGDIGIVTLQGKMSLGVAFESLKTGISSPCSCFVLVDS